MIISISTFLLALGRDGILGIFFIIVGLALFRRKPRFPIKKVLLFDTIRKEEGEHPR